MLLRADQRCANRSPGRGRSMQAHAPRTPQESPRSAVPPAQDAPSSPAPYSDEERVHLRLSGALLPVSGRLDAARMDGSRLDDSYLIKQARIGSTEAFEVLVRRYRDRIFRVALRMVGDAHSAEDVAQDALVSAWRGLASFRGEAEFSTWLHRIVLNSALSHINRSRLHGELTGDEAVEPEKQPERIVEAGHQEEALRAAVGALPFDQRAPLVLYQFEGYSYEQTADILQVSEATVRGRIYRARRALVESMKDWR